MSSRAVPALPPALTPIWVDVEAATGPAEEEDESSSRIEGERVSTECEDGPVTMRGVSIGRSAGGGRSEGGGEEEEEEA